MSEKIYNKQVCQNPQQMAKKSSLLDNLTLNAIFKWQPLEATFILIWISKF